MKLSPLLTTTPLSLQEISFRVPISLLSPHEMSLNGSPSLLPLPSKPSPVSSSPQYFPYTLLKRE